MKHKALFLDRDGVINHDPGDYTMTLEEFVLLPDVLKALSLAQSKGYMLIIITNQGGIAKGLYTHSTVAAMHDFFLRTCQESGVEIKRIFYSPHHPEFGTSLTRKPERLLMERALALYDIDPSRSVMIGDRERDVQCAAQVGVRGILIRTNSSILETVRALE